MKMVILLAISDWLYFNNPTAGIWYQSKPKCHFLLQTPEGKAKKRKKMEDEKPFVFVDH